MLEKKGLPKDGTLGIDAVTLEASAAMKGIVRKDDGKGWKDYEGTLAMSEGIQEPADADLQRMDRSRKDKKVSASPIARMKDGTAHLVYEAEHAVDLDTGAVVDATVTQDDRADGSGDLDRGAGQSRADGRRRGGGGTDG